MTKLFIQAVITAMGVVVGYVIVVGLLQMWFMLITSEPVKQGVRWLI